MNKEGHISPEQIRKGNKKAFKKLFEEYYVRLHRFVWGYVKSKAVAEELVQDLFLSIWENRADLDIEQSLKSYLFRAARNRSIDWLRHQKVEQEWRDEKRELNKQRRGSDQSERLHKRWMLDLVEEAIRTMPERRREVFMLSRYEKMTYKEIAEFLDISVSTVETHIGKALVHLRNKFLPLLSVLWMVL